MLAPRLGELVGMILEQELRVAVDPAQRFLQIVRRDVGEGVELPVAAPELVIEPLELLGALLKLAGAFRHTPLELLIHLLELTRLAVQLDEHGDLGAQNRRLDRDRHVVHRPTLVALELVQLGQVDGRDEDDRRLPEARMLADDLRELEAVQLRHAHVHQDDGDLGLEQPLQRLAGRARPDQVLAQVGEDGLVAEQLRRLVVDQQDVALFGRAGGIACHVSGLAV